MSWCVRCLFWSYVAWQIVSLKLIVEGCGLWHNIYIHNMAQSRRYVSWTHSLVNTVCKSDQYLLETRKIERNVTKKFVHKRSSVLASETDAIQAVLASRAWFQEQTTLSRASRSCHPHWWPPVLCICGMRSNTAVDNDATQVYLSQVCSLGTAAAMGLNICRWSPIAYW